MALPKSVDTAKVRAVSEAIDKMTAQEIATLPGLDDEDLRLFGAISQYYCFIDLNLRRALEIMHLAKRLPVEHVAKYPNYTDALLTDVLRGSFEKMDGKIDALQEILFRLEEIGRCRAYRNLLAHFAGKRYPNEDVYVFASKSNKDARQALGKELSGHRLHFAVAGRSELFELENIVKDHQTWLANKLPEWDARYLKV